MPDTDCEDHVCGPCQPRSVRRDITGDAMNDFGTSTEDAKLRGPDEAKFRFF